MEMSCEMLATARSYRSSDGEQLGYWEAGSGDALILLAGLGNSGGAWVGQLEGLSDRFRVIAPDHRGTGTSRDASRGYRLARLAKDLAELIDHLGLERVALVGHSMGCKTILSYIDLFGCERLNGIVLVDDAPRIVAPPHELDAWRKEVGEIWDADMAFKVLAQLSDPGEREAKLDGLFTPEFAASPRSTRWLACAGRAQGPKLAQLAMDSHFGDWRDVLPIIDVPTMVVGGRASFVPNRVQEWISARITGSRLEWFETDEGGSHLLFAENPTRFNALIAEFMEDENVSE